MIGQVIGVLQSVPLRPEAEKELEARYPFYSKANFDNIVGIVRGCVTNPIHGAATDKSGGATKIVSGLAI